MVNGSLYRDRSPTRLRSDAHRERERERARSKSFISPPRMPSGTPSTPSLMSPVATRAAVTVVAVSERRPAYAAADAVALRAVEDNLVPVVDALVVAEAENHRLEKRSLDSERLKRNSELAAAAERAERIHASTVHATELSAARREVEEAHGTIRKLQLELLDKSGQENPLQVSRLKLRLSELEHENDTLKQQLLANQHTLGLLGQDNTDTKEVCTRLRFEAERAAASVEEMSARNSTLRDSLSLTVAELNAHMTQAADGSALMNMKIKGLETELSDKDEVAHEMLRLQTMLSEAQAHLAEYDNLNVDLSSNAVRLIAQRALAVQHRGGQARCSVLRSAYWRLVRFWIERRVAGARAEADALTAAAEQDAAASSQALWAAQDEAARELQAARDEAARQLAALRDAHGEGSREAETLAAELEAERGRRRRAETSAADAVAEAKRLKSENARLQNQQRGLDDEASELREEVMSGHQKLSDDLLGMWKKLKQDVNAQLKRMHEQAEADRLAAERERDLDRKLRDAKQKLAEAEEELQEWKRKATEGLEDLRLEHERAEQKLAEENAAALRKVKKGIADEVRTSLLERTHMHTPRTGCQEASQRLGNRRASGKACGSGGGSP